MNSTQSSPDESHSTGPAQASGSKKKKPPKKSLAARLAALGSSGYIKVYPKKQGE